MDLLYDLLRDFEDDEQLAFYKKEIDGKCIYCFGAVGIPKENISYSTKHYSKTNEAYLKIIGEYEDQDTGFANSIDIKIPVNTNVYDGYEIDIKNGLVEVTLYEIKQPEPTLKDLSKK
ncbi:MAG: hypothetical protein E7413_00940 [Ruminococcaceae bacterium]|nr:hypothetical protein [Oscillospiraceae bacterium]